MFSFMSSFFKRPLASSPSLSSSESLSRSPSEDSFSSSSSSSSSSFLHAFLTCLRYKRQISQLSRSSQQGTFSDSSSVQVESRPISSHNSFTVQVSENQRRFVSDLAVQAAIRPICRGLLAGISPMSGTSSMGRFSHPLGWQTRPGTVVWNNPILTLSRQESVEPRGKAARSRPYSTYSNFNHSTWCPVCVKSKDMVKIDLHNHFDVDDRDAVCIFLLIMTFTENP